MRRRLPLGLALLLLLFPLAAAQPAADVLLEEGGQQQLASSSSHQHHQHHQHRSSTVHSAAVVRRAQWASFPKDMKAAGKWFKKAAKTVADTVVGIVECGFRGEKAVAKDVEKLTYPIGWRECTSKKALAAARKLVADGPDTCVVGRIEVESACLYEALVERRGAKFDAAQKFLVGDVIGGFLTHHPADGNSLPGLKKCMQKFPSLVDPDKSLWDVAEAAWTGSVNSWPFMQFSGPKQRELFDKKQCRPGSWSSSNSSAAAVRTRTRAQGRFDKDAMVLAPGSAGPFCIGDGDDMGLTNYSDPNSFKPGVIRGDQGHGWLERQRTQIGRIKKARSSQPYPPDHPWSFLDDEMVMVEPCNAASALSYVGTATNLCEMLGGADKLSPSSPHFDFARDAASAMSLLSIGNHLL